MLVRVCGSLAGMEGCNVWGSPLRFVQVTWSGLPCKNRPESCKNIQKQESGRSASKIALTSGLSHVQPQRRSKMVSHKFEHASWFPGFPGFPLQWLFSCHQGQSTHQNGCDLGGTRYHFMARNTSERFQEWNGMQRK